MDDDLFQEDQSQTDPIDVEFQQKVDLVNASFDAKLQRNYDVMNSALDQIQQLKALRLEMFGSDDEYHDFIELAKDRIENNENCKKVYDTLLPQYQSLVEKTQAESVDPHKKRSRNIKAHTSTNEAEIPSSGSKSNYKAVVPGMPVEKRTEAVIIQKNKKLDKKMI